MLRLVIISLLLVVSQKDVSYVTADVNSDVINERDCPLACTCTRNTITCSGTTLFPEDLPKETVEFIFANSSVSSVPANVFLNLPRLLRISLTSIIIGKVSACAFAELENMHDISFKDVHIVAIEGNAFSNLCNITRIAFEDSGIMEMKSYSFHGVTNVTSLQFSKTDISVIHPYRFLQINDTDVNFDNVLITRFLREGLSKFSNSSTLTIKDSSISQWQCCSLKSFIDAGGNMTRASVRQSYFGCSCSLSWLLTGYPEAPIISEESNRCKLSSSRLSTLTIDDVCTDAASRGRGCPPLHPSTVHTCSRKFDQPVQPEEKVDYPKYFTRTPASGSTTCFSRDDIAVFALIYMYVYVVMSCL